MVPSCLICKNRLETAICLLKERTQYSRTLLITSLSKIVKCKLDVISLHQTEICCTCQSLLNLIDEHESKLLAYENEVRLKFKLPFPIILEPKTDVPATFDEEPIIAEDLQAAANGDGVEAGPDDVIVSADDTGLVTVTYGQGLASGQGAEDHPSGVSAGVSSSAVLWEDAAEQGLVIIKEDGEALNRLLEELVPKESESEQLTQPAIRITNTPHSPKPQPSQPPSANTPNGSQHPQRKKPVLKTSNGSKGPKQSREEQIYFCDVCEATFSSTEKLADHRSNHNNRFQCRFCSQSFSSTKTLNLHQNAEHPQELLPCDCCEKRFSTRALLVQHRKKHDARQFQCEECMKSFATLHDLQLHITYKHSEERPFICEICRKAFKTASTLSRHKLKHTGLRPHVCSYCGMKFTLKFTMEKHAALHRRKTYPCSYCDKTFGRELDLEYHQQLHMADSDIVPTENDVVCPSDVLPNQLQRVLEEAVLESIDMQDLVEAAS